MEVSATTGFPRKERYKLLQERNDNKKEDELVLQYLFTILQRSQIGAKLFSTAVYGSITPEALTGLYTGSRAIRKELAKITSRCPTSRFK